jgi:TonB-linked SusC/RagA family outer membrane protein
MKMYRIIRGSEKPWTKISRIMKLTVILLFGSLVAMSASTYSQNTKLNLSAQKSSLIDIFRQIEDQSEFYFYFKKEDVKSKELVSVDLKDALVTDVLDQVLSKTGLEYKIIDRYVVVKEKGSNDPVVVQQEHKVTGKVTSTNGELLPGVAVSIKGTTSGAITNTDGVYQISKVDEGATLEFSFVGMVKQEIKVGTQAVINVTLREETIGVDEVVVVGYGTQKKSDITGSVTSVSKDRFAQIPVTNAMTAIEGAVAGVTVSNTSSIPGSTPNVQIRGINSINASTNPLIIVDGIPFAGSINYINPSDIASMEILKDASAVAIYGTRGSNGVILITTKRGVSGKPVIQYSTYAGFEEIAHILTPRDGASYVQKYKDYMFQTGQTQTSPVPNLYELDNYNAGKTTNWIDEASQQGFIQDHNISISGGAENIKYYISGDYLKQKGVVQGYNYERAGLRSNLEANVTDYLTTGVSLFIVSNNYNGGRVNLLNASAMSPYARLTNSGTGKYEIYPMYPELLYSNPMIGLYNQNVDERININTNFFTEFKPKSIPGFKYRLNASYNYNPTNAASYSGRDANNTVNGTATATNTQTSLWVIENILTYTKDIKKHHIDLTGLYSAQSQKYFSSGGAASGFVNDILAYNNMGAGATQTANSNASAYTMASQMGRLNYSFNSRYLLTVTARRDGYSAFGTSTSKYATFPSVALGWNISDESFMVNTKNFLDQLKLRASYGKSGNMAIGVNQTSTLSNTVSYAYNGATTITELANILGNPGLHWESTTGLNAGIDFSFLNSRISGSIEGYKTNTSDLLLKRNIPLITGYSSTWANIGKMENKGLDVTIRTINVAKKDFKWSTNLNFSIFRNKIVDLYGDKKSDIGNRWFIGQSLGTIYDYKMIGVWQTSEATAAATYGVKPGYLKFQDVNTDGKIDANDLVIQGSTQPKWTGGMTNTFDYKNFHLSIFIQTSQGSLKNDVDLSYADESGRRNTPAAVGYWTAENQSNTRPSLAYNNTYGYNYPRDNSFTRIKDVTLSYNFSKSLLQKTFLKDLTVYVSGRNLYTFTNWIGWDPEDNYLSRGVSNSSTSWTNNYPSVRSIVFGLNVTLK